MQSFGRRILTKVSEANGWDSNKSIYKVASLFERSIDSTRERSSAALGSFSEQNKRY
jgi:hypothetical protein